MKLHNGVNYYTAKEAIKELNLAVSEQSLRNWAKNGRIAVTVIGSRMFFD